MMILFKSTKSWLVVLAVLPVLLFAGCTKAGYVADKVSVRDIDLSSKTHQEAVEALKKLALDESTQLTLNVDGKAVVVTAGEVGAYYDAEKTADYLVEKSEGVFSGWFSKTYDPVVSVDDKLVDEIIKSHFGDIECDVTQTKVEAVKDGLKVTNGTSGKKIDREELTELIKEQFGNETIEEIEISYTITKPDKADYEKLLDNFSGKFQEAEYIIDADGNITVTEEMAGVTFDKNEVIAEMKEHDAEGEVYTIPCTVELPKYTKQYLEEVLFRDTLASYTTDFSTSTASRASNIALATSSINNLVLMPGDEFSFNETVGERTKERGYKAAGAYAAGKTVQEVGGGICQVSSTLYNTALLSNLEITSRRSHQMTVGYVPLGRDATVNWGTQDFKFKNNTEFPVKLVGEVVGRKVTISAVGTLIDPDREVKIVTSIVSVISPIDEIEEDPEKPFGEQSVEKGKTGYIVDAERVVYSGEDEISREKLTRSKYNPTNNIITIGTLGRESSTDLPPGL